MHTIAACRSGSVNCLHFNLHLLHFHENKRALICPNILSLPPSLFIYIKFLTTAQSMRAVCRRTENDLDDILFARN